MENINNDIIKLTTLLESTKNDCNESSDDDEEELILQNIPKTNDLLSESITNDEDTLFIIETCSNPLIKNALICNIKKRNILKELIKNLEENITKIRHIQRERFIQSLNSNELNRKSIIRKRLGIPYFKDKYYFPCPPNEDFILMQKNKQFSVLDCHKNQNWSQFFKCKLVLVVYQSICNNKCRDIEVELDSLQKVEPKDENIFAKLFELQSKFIKLKNTELINLTAKHWQYITIKPDGLIYNKNELMDKTEDMYFILTEINNAKMKSTDWQKISHEHFNLKFTAMECESMWSYYLHPKYSKNPWKEADNAKLQELVVKWNYENWDAIADELNIQKSAYQCCVHFYSKLYDKFIRTKWTIEENQKLKDLVDASRIGDYINWSKVAHYFKGRTKAQIYTHYYNVVVSSLTKGSFTIEEDVLLLTLLKLYNNDMKKVKLYFSNRSLAQLRDRFKTMCADDSQEWTLQDDCRIIEHIELHGAGKWHLLDMNRSKACVRHRYHTLKKWFEQNPKDDLQDVQRRYKTAYRRKIKNHFNLLNTAVKELLQIVKNHPTDDKTILNLTYIHKKVLSTIPYYKSIKKNKKNTSFFKNKFKTPKAKFTDSEGTLHNQCLKFFEPACKKISRGKGYMSTEDFAAKAKRVANILELLGVKLKLPTDEDEVNENIMLTISDKGVLHEMIKLSNEQDRNDKIQLQYLIPPTPETLTGLRGIMLHSPTLRAHSRGNYEGYNFYVYAEQHFEKKGITYIKRLNELFLSNLNNEDKQKVINERALFWKRLKILFSWPCIMQDTKIIPNITEPVEVIDLSEPKKRGRPVKSKDWKIHLMNKARLDKKNKELNESLPSTSQTNTENPFEITKHTGNTFSIQFKSTCVKTETHKTKSINQEESDSDDELDEDIQKLVKESDDRATKIANNSVIDQMSKAIKNILVKNSNETENETVLNIGNNKRKAKMIVVSSKKVKNNQNK